MSRLQMFLHVKRMVRIDVDRFDGIRMSLLSIALAFPCVGFIFAQRGVEFLLTRKRLGRSIAMRICFFC